MKKIVFALLMVSIFAGCKKEAEPDQTTEFTGKYDNGVLLINGSGIATPSQAIVTHTISRNDNSTLHVETEIKSTSSTNLGNTGKAVLRVSSTIKYGKQTDAQWTFFESNGGYVKAYFRKINNTYNLNINIVQSDGTKIDNTVATRN